MSSHQSLALPPGFEQLSKEQQIDYVQQLWDLIVAVPDEVPVPEWHLEIVRERVSSQSTAQVTQWSEVKQRLLIDTPRSKDTGILGSQSELAQTEFLLPR